MEEICIFPALIDSNMVIIGPYMNLIGSYMTLITYNVSLIWSYQTCGSISKPLTTLEVDIVFSLRRAFGYREI